MVITGEKSNTCTDPFTSGRAKLLLSPNIASVFLIIIALIIFFIMGAGPACLKKFSIIVTSV